MNKKLLAELKEKLENEKAAIEKQLATFADKDPNLKGDWDSKFPNFGKDEKGGSALETAADEVEEYTTRLPVEFSLETKLKDINLALEKVRTSLSARTLNASHFEKSNYGKCENCHKEIERKRLKILPSARLCMKCQK